MDTGSTDHVCPVQRLFQRYRALEQPRVVWISGEHKLILKELVTRVTKVLTEVLFVPTVPLIRDLRW